MKREKILLLTIVLLAGFSRFYNLGKNPPSLDWDEASIGYNAYSLLKTGKDEYGNSWPLSIRSFDDYKPPLYTYLTIPSIAVFGLTEFAVRFPSALAGTLTVLLAYFLVTELFKGNKPSTLPVRSSLGEGGYPQPSTIGLIAAFLLAMSPWHLQFSRVAFEANLAAFFFVMATYLLVKGLNSNQKTGEQKNIFLTLASISFAATLYSYHSARIVVPVFLLLLLMVYRRLAWSMKTTLVWLVFLWVVLLLPLGLTVMRGAVKARFTTVSVFTNPGIFTSEAEQLSRQSAYGQEDLASRNPLRFLHSRSLVLAKIVIEGYLRHFDPKFLFLEGDGIGRHSVPGVGLVYLWELPFLLVGTFLLLTQKNQSLNLLIPWLLAAPAASALTTQTPHAVRSLLLLFPLAVTTAYGVAYSSKLFSRHRYTLAGMLVLAIGNVFYYFNLYHVHYPVERAHDWQYGYSELVRKIENYEERVERVVVTTKYDQPHIFFLFYKRVDPAWYQPISEAGWQGFGKYAFEKIDYETLKKIPNILIAATPDELPSDITPIDKILYPNGKPAFLITKT